MSNSNKRKPSGRLKKPGNELLNELDSIKELLDDELDHPPSYGSVADIDSVKEYLRIKKVADAAKLSVEEYLSQHTGTTKSEEQPINEDGASEDAIPVLDDVISTDETIPVLTKIPEISPNAGNGEISVKKIHQLVDIIVNHKLERLRPQLKKEVINELQKLLPINSQKKK